MYYGGGLPDRPSSEDEVDGLLEEVVRGERTGSAIEEEEGHLVIGSESRKVRLH